VSDLGDAMDPSEEAKILQLTLQATRDGIVRLDLARDRAHYSPRWMRLFGFEGDEPKSSTSSNDLWRTLIHPDELGDVESMLKDHIYHNWPFSTTIRMAHRHGGYRHILCRAATERDAEGNPQQVVMVFADITDRIRMEERQAAIARALPDTLIHLDASANVMEVIRGVERPGSPFAELQPGSPLPECLAKSNLRNQIAQLVQPERRNSRAGQLLPIEVVSSTTPGFPIYHELRVFPYGRQEVLCMARDITDQRALEQQLAQAQKLQAVGHLAAGVAHEINTPMQFIGDNLHFIKSAFDDMVPYVTLLREMVSKAGEAALDESDLKRVARAHSNADVDYTMDALPNVVERSLAGVERVTRIVQAMKAFSHPTAEFASVDLRSLLDSTITVATNEWKYVAEVELDVPEGLPMVRCVAGELNQVILNLIVNASHAIGDVVGTSGDKGKIRISAHEDGASVIISVGDTGAGIPEAIRSKVFDPFFTTKEVGKGTGQGLALAHSCVVERHKGTIHFESEVGRGTTFIIRLPTRGPAVPEEQGVAA
jgi:PAS domain S-box-containing protein